MDELERYLFDLRGYHFVPDAIPRATVDDLNHRIDDLDIWGEAAKLDLAYGAASWWQVSDHPWLRWILPKDENHLHVGPLMSWGPEWASALSTPPLTDTAQQLLGPDCYTDHASLVVARQGGRGLDLHGGPAPYMRHQYYAFREGVFDVGMLAVVIALTQQSAESGGLAIVPGSHKANVRVPGRISAVEAARLSWIDKLDIPPGAAVFFPEATAHAVLPWAATWERRAILMKLYPAHLRAFGAPLRDPDTPFWAAACKDDMPFHPLRVGAPTTR
ncbi:MAG: hypothetical protein JWM19_5308 [Actinomycetia bacterium]|nr:hypothetical protein [Actinomycetes bacterium]